MVMTLKQFAEFATKFREDMKAITDVKNVDYSLGDDAMSNFVELGRLIGIRPEQVFAVFMMKHVTAVMRWVAAGRVESEGLRGRFLDVANYAILGAALAETLATENQGTTVTTISTDNEEPDFLTELKAMNEEEEELCDEEKAMEFEPFNTLEQYPMQFVPLMGCGAGQLSHLRSIFIYAANECVSGRYKQLKEFSLVHPENEQYSVRITAHNVQWACFALKVISLCPDYAKLFRGLKNAHALKFSVDEEGTVEKFMKWFVDVHGKFMSAPWDSVMGTITRIALTGVFKPIKPKVAHGNS